MTPVVTTSSEQTWSEQDVTVTTVVAGFPLVVIVTGIPLESYPDHDFTANISEAIALDPSEVTADHKIGFAFAPDSEVEVVPESELVKLFGTSEAVGAMTAEVLLVLITFSELELKVEVKVVGPELETGVGTGVGTTVLL